MGKWRLLILVVALLFTAGCAGNDSFDLSSGTSEDTPTVEALVQNGDDDGTSLSPTNDDLNDDRDEEAEFTGRVDAVNDDGSYVIDERTVLVDDDTVFDDEGGSIAVGMRVKVEGWRRSNDSVLAREIEIEDDTDDMDGDRDDDMDDDDDRDDDMDNDRDDDDLNDDRDDEAEFTGRVDAVNDDGSYTIDGQTVFVDDDTEFDDFDADALNVGMWVKVEARRRSDGSLIAYEIELEDDLDDMDDDRDDDMDDDRDDDMDDDRDDGGGDDDDDD